MLKHQFYLIRWKKKQIKRRFITQKILPRKKEYPTLQWKVVVSDIMHGKLRLITKKRNTLNLLVLDLKNEEHIYYYKTRDSQVEYGKKLRIFLHGK